MVAALVLCTTTTTGAADKPPIKIGLLYSLSGMAAVVTEGTVYAHEIAAEEINAKGGLLGGRKIEYVTRDDKLKPGEAVKEFRRMVTRDKVDFVMGVISSGVALAVSEVAKEMKVLFVDTIAQTATLTEEQGHPYVVRTTQQHHHWSYGSAGGGEGTMEDVLFYWPRLRVGAPRQRRFLGIYPAQESGCAEDRGAVAEARGTGLFLAHHHDLERQTGRRV